MIKVNNSVLQVVHIHRETGGKHGLFCAPVVRCLCCFKPLEA